MGTERKKWYLIPTILWLYSRLFFLDINVRLLGLSEKVPKSGSRAQKAKGSKGSGEYLTTSLSLEYFYLEIQS